MLLSKIVAPSITPLQISVARFTYVPDEYYDTIETAFAAKPLAEWTALIPRTQFTLLIDQSLDRVLMKCLDGPDIRVALITWC